jgi:glycogen(starch) synthase
MREMGFEVHYGYWLVTGRPKVVLINPFSIYTRLGEIKYLIWEHHNIPFTKHDDLLDQVVAFGYLVKIFTGELSNPENTKQKIIAHFHEWMTGLAIPEIRLEQQPITTVFTTHATLLGRYLAMNHADFYDFLPYFNWEIEAQKYLVESQVKMERAAAHGSHVFTTVSEVTARECETLLGRVPDVILPNGLNIQRFVASHEFQNLHGRYKEKIHDFVMGHFFQSYSFDLDKTLYFFISGRYEYRNKGFDMALEALARLNWKMQQINTDTTVVMFIVTKQPYHSINPAALQSKAILNEIRETCHSIESRVGEKLFNESTSRSDAKMPDLNSFVDDYWKLRLRRTIQAWRSHQLPTIVTHNLVHEGHDEVLNFLRNAHLVNNRHDKVKFVYHPDFISSSSPLFGMEYAQFVRGCHLGVFPSYYEPWGYTPLECMASGVAAVTSDLSGFGDYVIKNMPDHEKKGVLVVTRDKKNFYDAAEDLANQMFNFVQLSRNERIAQRYAVEDAAQEFDWSNLTYYYSKAYSLALQRL